MIRQYQYFLLLNLKGEIFKKLNIKYSDIQIKQASKVKYLGRLLDEKISGKAMTLNIPKKINNKLKCFYRENIFQHQH